MNRIRKNRAFTLVEIMIVVLIIGILLAIAVPQFVNARTQSQQSTCIANLSQIESAKEQWAMETAQPATAMPQWSDLVGPVNSGTGYLKSQPNCPSGGTYTIQTLAIRPTCTVANHALQ
jgi:prepilin-type N-terminal cleavage/methylation domain-containing protein